MIYRMGQDEKLILTSPPGSDTKVYRPAANPDEEWRVVWDFREEIKPYLIGAGVIGAGLLALKLLT